MIAPLTLIRRTIGDTSGSIAVEFGLLGPLAIAMMLGVLQVGIAMQSYNAIRNISADVARNATVQYQTNNTLTNTQIEQQALATAVNPPYLLMQDELDAVVIDAGTQRVTGAIEKTITITYQIPSILTLLGYSSPSISFSRPIFLFDNAA